jgi:site-specific DNA-methyltransferase (adenine-specific)
VWGGNYYKLEPSRCWLLWDKKQNDSWTTGQAEMAWTNLDRPVRVFRFAQCEQASEGPKFHPTQKPLALMAWCLKWVSAPTVLDPFMGSGSTGVACAMHRRGFVGIERERKYFDIACERIAQAQAQGTLLPPEPAAAAVQSGLAFEP